MTRRMLLVIAAGVALGVVWICAAATADQEKNGAIGAYHAYIDPSTGAWTDRATDAAALSTGIQNALSTSSAGLHEAPGPLGGVVVDLQGRFQNAAIAIIDENGNLEAPCVNRLPGAENGEGGDE